MHTISYLHTLILTRTPQELEGGGRAEKAQGVPAKGQAKAAAKGQKTVTTPECAICHDGACCACVSVRRKGGRERFYSP